MGGPVARDLYATPGLLHDYLAIHPAHHTKQRRDDMDFLRSAVSSAISKGPPFPYIFGDKVDVDNSIWSLYNGTRKVPASLHRSRSALAETF